MRPISGNSNWTDGSSLTGLFITLKQYRNSQTILFSAQEWVPIFSQLSRFVKFLCKSRLLHCVFYLYTALLRTRKLSIFLSLAVAELAVNLAQNIAIQILLAETCLRSAVGQSLPFSHIITAPEASSSC